MEQTFVYKPEFVCSRQITIVHEDGIIKKVTFVGGCGGNTQGVARLSEGRPIAEVIGLLENIVCPATREHRTSCPAQLAQALKKIQS
ncbi:MAG: TIGR03905 family TSCPD domain-containing protein [Bacilli bacterium]|nr:TIGR03905 family TSCPD domain-containing protein [Bacilli bacterium]